MDTGKKRNIQSETNNFSSEILQVVNRLSGNVNTDEFLARAQSLLVQISRSISTPPIIKQLLNLSDL